MLRSGFDASAFRFSTVAYQDGIFFENDIKIISSFVRLSD